MTTVAASLNQFQAISNQTFTTMNRVTQVLQQNVTVQQNFNKAVEEGKKKAFSLADTAKKIGFYLESAQKLAKLTIGGAAQEEGLKNAFIARTGSQDAGTAMFDKFRQEAVQTGMDVNDSLSGALAFFSSTKDSGQISKLSQLARQMSVFDTGGKGIKGAADALKEALNGDVSSLSKSFNIPKADLQAFKIEDLAKSGNIEGFITAFDQLLEKQGMGQQAFETMLDSPALKWEGILNNLTAKFAVVGQGALTALAPILDLFGNALQDGTFEPFFQILMIGLTLIGQGLAWVANNVIWLAGILFENWVPIAFGLLPFILVKLWSMIAPIVMQASAWLMAQWPILLIGLAIGLLIYILLQCGVTTEQIVGTIMGIFYSLFAFIYNHIAVLWDTLVSFGEFFANLFVDPVYAIQKLIYDLAMIFGGYMINMLRSVETFAGGFVKLILKAVNKVLGAFNWFVEKFNSIFGSKFSTATLLDENNIHILSDSLQGALNSIQKPTSSKPVADFSKYKMGQITMDGAFSKGYSTGANFVGKLKGMKLPDLKPDMDALGKWDAGIKTPAIPKGVSGGGNTPALSPSGYRTGAMPQMTAMPEMPQMPQMPTSLENVGRVDKVGAVEDEVDISSEDLKVMRELAEMKSIQNFVTLTPTIHMTTGDINSGYSIDTIIDRIEKKLEEEFITAAQGVYA